MKTNPESGNALIYVLVAIVLFAGLSFTLMRQTDTNEAGALNAERVELLATQITSYAAQAKSSVDQMLFQNLRAENLSFARSGEAGFETEPPRHIMKVFHPDGGGLTPGQLPAEAISQSSTTPPAGWYMGRFNNVEWTPSVAEDIILTAHQIHPDICRNLNRKITGSDAIPALTGGNLSDVLIDTSTNNNLTAALCPGCGENFSLCISNSDATMFSFYSIIVGR
ncbi:MAG: hypothetical protein ACK4VI_05155 [Alphaproteobacteria bacterium]